MLNKCLMNEENESSCESKLILRQASNPAHVILCSFLYAMLPHFVILLRALKLLLVNLIDILSQVSDVLG